MTMLSDVPHGHIFRFTWCVGCIYRQNKRDDAMMYVTRIQACWKHKTLNTRPVTAMMPDQQVLYDPLAAQLEAESQEKQGK